MGEKETPKQAEKIKLSTLYEETLEMESNRANQSLQTPTQKEKLNGPQMIPQMIPNSNVPEVDEEWGNKLWDAVNQAKNETTESVKPPLVEVDFDQRMLELELRSDNYDGESEKSGNSKAETLKTLPSYQGDYEADSEVRKLPSQKLNSSPNLT